MNRPEGFWAVGKPGVEYVRKAMKDAGLSLNEENPDILFCYGGDGTTLRAGRQYPNSSLLLVIKDSFGGLGQVRSEEFDKVLEKVKKGEYEIDEVSRIEMQHKDEKFWAMNEIVVYRDDEQCNRMRVESSGKDLYGVELIGDGIIASTASGSTGYNYVAGGEVLDRKDKRFQVLPLECSYKGDSVVNGRRVLTRVRSGKLFPEGKEVKVTFNRAIKNKIVPDSLHSERKYFNFKEGDYITIRSAKDKSRFVRMR